MLCTKTLHQQRCRGCGLKGLEAQSGDRWWLPGIVVVEFRRRLSPDQLFRFSNAMSQNSKTDLHLLDQDKFRRIIGNRQVKPPKWTFQFEQDKPPATRNYERFVTFFLDPKEDVPALARDLSAVGGVVRATPEPILAPPIPRISLKSSAEPSRVAMVEAFSADVSAEPLLNEPLAVSGGDPFGRAVYVGLESLQNQWYLFRSKADVVLSDNTNGAGVVVAVVDWGFNVDHQEFQDKIQYTYNASKNDNNVSSGSVRWHGTASLGLVGAGDNDAGMLGFAAGAELWAIQGQDSSSSVDNQSWARAIEEARQKSSNDRPKVILIEAATSGSYNVESSPSIREPIKTAIQDGCVVVVAAGNLGVDAGKGPNRMPIPETGSILVGATQYRGEPDDIKRGVSNWGSRIVVSAPGANSTDVTCCDCGNNTYTNHFGGTSGAAAKVAGAMALVLERFPEATHQQIVEALRAMPQITTADREMGCFLDVANLITQVNLLLS